MSSVIIRSREGKTEIWVDGHKLHGVSAFDVYQDIYTRYPRMSLELDVTDLTIEQDEVEVEYED